MTEKGVVQLIVGVEDTGTRVDVYLATKVPDISRSFAALLIRQGSVQIDGACVKPGHKVKPREQIAVRIPEPSPVELVPEPIPLDIIYEDPHIIVINKPPGLVVHPAAGHASGTLVNGILHHCPDLEGIGGEHRPGIVHRLDKDTSGIMVVAKTHAAHLKLSHQFKSRGIEKRYRALIYGTPGTESGRIDLPVGRHPVDRKKMSTTSPHGREALTLWRIKERFAGSALLEVDLKTGRTHQIRVHCQAMGHPLVGDPVYGYKKKRLQLAKSHPAAFRILDQAPRQMLHAANLRFSHPVSGKLLDHFASIPRDMTRMIEQLRSEKRKPLASG
jgi:23S rRNA pseudouridine1911/1915/1917 synthase